MRTIGANHPHRDPSGVGSRYTRWRRADQWTDPTTGDTWPSEIWSAGPADITPSQPYYSGYDSRCGWCWLGSAHTQAEHSRQVTR